MATIIGICTLAWHHMDTLKTIIAHGLSIRQIPLVKRWCMDIRHAQPGDETFERTHKVGSKTVTRQYCRKTKIPANAGYWMCKVVDDTGSLVRWSIKTDNLAPTLRESVELYLKSIGQYQTPMERLQQLADEADARRAELDAMDKAAGVP